MFNCHDLHSVAGDDDAVDDTKVTPPGGVETLELEPKGFAKPYRVVRKRSVAELDDGGPDLLWKS